MADIPKIPSDAYLDEAYTIINQSIDNSNSAADNANVSLVNLNNLQKGVRTKNLFNKKAVTVGYYVPSGSGTLTASANYSASDLIEIEAGQTYTVSTNAQQGAWFDKDKKYISGWGTYGSTATLPAAPSNGKYMRITVRNADVATLQIEKGTSATAYTPYILIDTDSIPSKSIDSTKVDEGTIPTRSVPGKNLFNKLKVTTGYYVSSGNGALTANANYSASDFIPIVGGASYTISPDCQQGAWFDANKTYISGWGTYGATTTLPAAPSNAAFMRASLRNTTIDTFQIEKSTFATSYESYKLLVPQSILQLPISNQEYQRIFSIMKKLITATADNPINIVCIGDSITQGVGGTGFAQDGELILSLYNGTQKWYVNTNGHCWANSLRDYLQDKFHCNVKNYGMSGAVVSFLNEGLNQGALVGADDDIVILQIGTNNRNGNVSGTKDDFRDALDSLVKRIKGMGKDVILMSSIPASITNETDNKKYHMEDVDHQVMAVAEMNNMEYISNYKNFIQYCKEQGVTIDSLLADGLHPNDAGYDVMFYLICNALGIGTKREGATW